MPADPPAARRVQLRLVRVNTRHHLEWFFRNVFGLDPAQLETVLGGEVIELVVDRFRLARLVEASQRWDAVFECEPPIEASNYGGVENYALERVGLRIVDLGPNKGRSLGLLRELTQLPMREALRVVGAPKTVLNGLKPAEASELIARFTALGAEVEIVRDQGAQIAFNPRDRARGDQWLERVRVGPCTLTHERGQFGTWSSVSVERFVDDEQRDAALERQCEGWRGVNLELARDEIELLNWVSSREPTLEAEIVREREHAQAAHIFADWLLARGDPRGEIAALMLARDEIEDKDEREPLSARITELIEHHRRHLFGPFAETHAILRPRWSAGLVVGLSIGEDADKLGALPGLTLARVLDLPVVACLRQLALAGDWTRHADLGARFMHPVCAGLRQLRMSASGVDLREVSWSRLERLEELKFTVFMGELELGALELPALRVLGIQMDRPSPALSQAIYNSSFPELERLELRFYHLSGEEAERGEVHRHLDSLLEAPSLAGLRELALACTLGDPSFAVVEALAASPLMQTLELLDLRSFYVRGAAETRLRQLIKVFPGRVIRW